jgi:hypothetical protein
MYRLLTKYFLLALGSLLTFGSANAGPDGWVIGEEQEYHSGNYATYWGGTDGWHLWSLEDKEGRYCRAHKTTESGAVSVPILERYYDDKSPFVAISSWKDQSRSFSDVKIDGFPRSAKEFRAPTDRFFQDYDFMSADWTKYEGEVLEFHLSGYEEVRLNVGYFDERFEIDFTGATRAELWVMDCLAHPQAVESSAAQH